MAPQAFRSQQTAGQAEHLPDQGTRLAGIAELALANGSGYHQIISGITHREGGEGNLNLTAPEFLRGSRHAIRCSSRYAW